MKVYHGTTTWKMHSLISGDFSKRFPGLYVTDTFERAARYANSQADQSITQRSLPLASCAAVVEIEIEDDLTWGRRADTHPTLDQCEAVIQQGTITAISIGRPGKTSYREQGNVARVQEQLPVPIHILDPLPTIHNS